MRARLVVGLMGLGALIFGRAASAAELQAPQNIHGTPGTPQSAELATRAAVAQMNGRPTVALALAEQGIQADPDDPWPYYGKAMALSELGRVDDAAAAFAESERRFLPGDLWGKSVALYGRGHAYAQVGRCADARKAFDQVRGADRQLRLQERRSRSPLRGRVPRLGPQTAGGSSAANRASGTRALIEPGPVICGPLALPGDGKLAAWAGPSRDCSRSIPRRGPFVVASIGSSAEASRAALPRVLIL